MSEAVLAEFSVRKPADVTVAARKARVLAALADIDRPRRVRFGKSLTESCRGILALGGSPLVRYAVDRFESQPTIEAVVTWQDSHTTEDTVSTKSEDAPDLAMRRVGELLDSFSLEGWPGTGATVTLRLFASPGLSLTEEDVAHWSDFLSETQVEEVVRHAEQRRRLLVSELQSSLQQEELLTEVGGEATETGLVTMLSLVASKTDNGVAILASNGLIVWVNEAFSTHTGFSHDQCHGRPLIEQISHADTDTSAVTDLKHTLDSSSSGYVELLIGRRDGTSCWAGINLTPVFEADDTVGRWIVLMRDVTQQKQHQEAMAAARDSAEKASRSKSEFLANMSHEIRTPMNAVIGMTELALGTELTPEQQEYLSTVRMSAESLLELLNDILDLSKIEAGKVELDEVDFDLADVVRDALKSLAVKAHGKGLELATHLPMNLPHHLHGDPLRLRQVLINLVGNAIKFTERGEVIIEFSARNDHIPSQAEEADGPLGEADSRPGDEGDVPTHLHFTVRDTGVGIAPERLDRIFEAFTQADASTTRQFGGTGLGLTITAELLRLMGGQIRVESEAGVGSSFHVSIPLQPATDEPQPFARRVEFSREQLEGRTVLVVDDNATNRRILEEMLSNWGLRPRITDGAPGALKELEAAAYYGRPFDLMIVDSMMPETDGFGLLSRIRERGDLQVDTVMMLSSADRTDSSRRCRELGVSTYLVKPVSQSGLLESIVSLLEQSAALEKHGEQFPRQAAAELAQSEHALVPLHILIADDHPSNRTLAERILEKRGHRSTHAGTGKEVLAKLETDSFDLILMDVQMPELDGFQTTAEIRSGEQTSGLHMPIVALTAHAMKGDREKCLAAGMDAYLSKPLRSRELIALVEKLCEPVAAARIGTAAARPDIGIVTSSAETSISSGDPDEQRIDFSGALDRMDGDRELLAEQMMFFLEDAPSLLGEISKAIESETAQSLQSAAHRLKGLVASYDLAVATELCLRLEIAGRDGVFDGTKEILEQLTPLVDRLSEAVRLFVATQE